MARREIRRMLLTPKKRLRDRPWALPALMGAVLVLGVALGVGIGLLAVDQEPPPMAPQVVIDRPPRPEEMLAPPRVEAPVVPDVTVPVPRPGGPADDGFDPNADDELPPAPQSESAPETAAPLPPIPPQAGYPAWKRHAVTAPRTAGLPMIAIVIDDMGVDRKRTERIARLRAPLTLSWLTYADELPMQVGQARKRGHEMMLHVPMEPQGESYDPGPDVLEVGLPEGEIRRRLVLGLGRMEGFVGINNHMGSRFTTNTAGMKVVMEELKRRGLLFLDSVTASQTVGEAIARKVGVPFAERHVFLDNDTSVASVHTQLAQLESHARRTGFAIAIGHPRDNTIEALQSWLPSLEARGFVLVPLTTIVKAAQIDG